MPTEADGFAGWYLPFSENYAVDLSGTHYRFTVAFLPPKQDYSEGALSVLLYDTVKLGYRYSEDYMGLDKPGRPSAAATTCALRALIWNFIWPIIVSVKPMAASVLPYSAGERNDYWHFRIGVERNFGTNGIIV